MESWRDLSRASYGAAQELLATGRWRSAVSRAYYAAYSALTGELAMSKGVTFKYGGNPSHRQLPELIRNHFRAFGRDASQEFAKIIRDLLRSRLQADYSPPAFVDQKQAMDSVRRAAEILKRIGV